jgi:hypothetical protein
LPFPSQAAFNEADSFESRGGLKAMGDAMGRGMVLVLSLWDDHAARMLWLDSQVSHLRMPRHDEFKFRTRICFF